MELNIRYFIAETIVKWFKQWGFCGAFRSKIIRLGYKIFGGCRDSEWDFVLQYFPVLSSMHRNKLNVLNVGCTASLLIYELAERGYITSGLDQRDFQEKLPKDIVFYKEDITNFSIKEKFDYIIALSMIEHVGLRVKTYDTVEIENGPRKAMETIHRLLKDDGYFIITVPIEHWKNTDMTGYNPRMFYKLIKGFFDIYELTQRDGQICATLIKSL